MCVNTIYMSVGAYLMLTILLYVSNAILQTIVVCFSMKAEIVR